MTVKLHAVTAELSEAITHQLPRFGWFSGGWQALTYPHPHKDVFCASGFIFWFLFEFDFLFHGLSPLLPISLFLLMELQSNEFLFLALGGI